MDDLSESDWKLMDELKIITDKKRDEEEMRCEMNKERIHKSENKCTNKNESFSFGDAIVLCVHLVAIIVFVAIIFPIIFDKLWPL